MAVRPKSAPEPRHYVIRPQPIQRRVAEASKLHAQLVANSMQIGARPCHEELGEVLFELAFPGVDAQIAYATELAGAYHEDGLLTTWIESSDATLQALPWEYLRVPKSARKLFEECGVKFDSMFLGLHRYQTIVRRAGPEPATPHRRELRTLRILIAWANPGGLWPEVASVQDEAARIRSSLADLEPEILEVPVASEKSLVEAVKQFRPDVIHFTGHGYSPSLNRRRGAPEEPALVCGNAGKVEYVTAQELYDAAQGTPAAVFILNCCFGAFSDAFAPSFAAQFLALGDEPQVVVANQGPISLFAAAGFTTQLYRALALGSTVGEAASEFRRALVEKHARGDGCADWGLPVVFLRSREARLWETTSNDPYPIDFGPIFAAHNDFVGRAFLTRQIRDYADGLRRSEQGGVFLLTAAPGVGKTAFLSHLIRPDGEEQGLQTEQEPIHFLYGAGVGYRDPGVFLRHVYKDVQNRCGEIEPAPTYSVETLGELLKRAGAKAFELKATLFIVIDALDEASETEQGLTAVDLVPASVPQGVCVIAASRPGPQADLLSSRVGVERYDLAGNSPANIEDAKAFSERKIFEMMPEVGRSDAPQAKALAARIAEKAEGNFLVLRSFFADQKQEQSLDSLERAVAHLTGSMLSMYERFFDRIRPGTGKGARNPVYELLRAMAAAQAPVTQAMVCQAFRLRTEVWDEIRQFVVEGGVRRDGRGERTFRLYHHTFREFLERRFEADLPVMHHRWATFTGRWRDLAGYARRYALENLPVHLQSAGETAKLSRQLLDLAFAQPRLQEIGPYGYTSYFRRLRRADEIPGNVREELHAIERVLDQNTHLLAHDPDAFLERVQNGLKQRLDNSERTRRLTAGVTSPRPWLRLKNSPPLGMAESLIRILDGHTDGVTSLAVDQGRGLIVSASADLVKVWELETGRELRSLETGRQLPTHDDDFGGPFESVSVAVEAARGVAVSGSNNGVKVWDLESGRLLRTLDASGESVAVEGTRGLVVCGNHGSIDLWDLDTGHLVRTLAIGPCYDSRVAVDGARGVVVAGVGCSVQVWDLETGSLLRTWEGHMSYVNAVAVDGAHGVVVSGSGDGSVQVWDLETGRLVHKLEGHTDVVTSVAVDDVTGLAVSGSRDRTVKVWELGTGRLLRSLEGHQDVVTSVAVDGLRGLLVSGSSDQKIKVWDLGTMRSSANCEQHANEVASAAVDWTCSVMVSGFVDGSVKVWELKTGRLLRTLEGHMFDVDSVTVDGARGLVVSGSSSGKAIKVWELGTGLVLSMLKMKAPRFVTSLAVDGVRGLLVSGSLDGTVLVWDVKAARLLRTLEGHTDVVTSVAVDDVTGLAVSGSEDRTVKVWELETGRLLRGWAGHTDGVTSVAMDGVAGLVVSGSSDHLLKLWELRTGRLLHTLDGHSALVHSVAVDGTRGLVVSASQDQTVKAWDSQTGKLLLSREFASPILTVSLRPNRSGSLAVTEAGEGGVPRCWEFIVDASRP